jgi:methylenetetrahydrofolate--tRNA-(uracil-5-)-methyltransferase
MSRRPSRVFVIGGGLAGSEAAWQAARHGADVTLCEMRSTRMTEAHRTDLLAELVCSNSFKSDRISNANGLLKLELRMLGSLLMETASRTRVPAGSALCVDRTRFARHVTRAIEGAANIRLEHREVSELADDAVNIIAAGPLASPAISDVIENLVGKPNLYFYDAISPIIEADSIDMTIAFKSSRYGKGDSTYLNLPMDKGQYEAFINDLRQAQVTQRREFERKKFFSACMPVEELAGMGDETLSHGCMKPVGLTDPRTGSMPWAVAQLRPENLEGTLYGMVGFQTRLKYGDQERIFRSLPGLRDARFARLGSIHRNTFVRAPSVIRESLELDRDDNVMFAGQLTGAEGYVAAVATGLVAGINAARKVKGEAPYGPPRETLLGGLLRYISGAPAGDFQPMNPNFGLIPALGARVRERQRRNLLLSERSALTLKAWIKEAGLDSGAARLESRVGE